MLNNRAIAATLICQVLDKGVSLSDGMVKQTHALAPGDKGQIQDFVYSTLRQLPTFSFCLNQLTEQKLSKELNITRYLICLGMYQLTTDRVAAHAAIAETVEACRQLGFEKLTGLVNGVLRNFERQKESLLEKAKAAGLQVSSNHPQWLLSMLKKAYPKGFKKIVKANLQHPPFWLRVNTKVNDASSFCQALDALEIPYQQDKKYENTLLLEQAVAVSKLPDFSIGSCAVQDKAAQQAALLLDAQPGERILDACAAPGGKTAHILSHTPDVKEVVALDVSDERLKRVTENLTRLQLNATVVTGDAAESTWWDGALFDRILLDAPCSATGVIRRHPDIMYLRRETDIATLAALQNKILQQMWAMLKPGGTLVYATCSVLPAENKEQITAFLQQQPDAKLIPIFNTETDQDPGWQILPGVQNMDGFYYAKLQKQ
ncbi:16S rRNA (cytosine(967)-C(5))-methyltransferase RsmB [Algibacillus agarilyticus]|uniref:16S rRNA (cytosine(967)-C(5))-methyltransferase RsmB n=1 Tax=Algibacillus agarilyticus TaxID=2234133 RepID=UPI000DD0B133|nr:16S rRNA (cytosine(967)-C(5))-methyltransferase RsmB [Algibacillus agarilyticus]